MCSASAEPLGDAPEAVLGHLGGLLRRAEAILGALGALLGRLRLILDPLRRSWGSVLEASWAAWKPLGGPGRGYQKKGADGSEVPGPWAGWGAYLPIHTCMYTVMRIYI